MIKGVSALSKAVLGIRSYLGGARGLRRACEPIFEDIDVL